MNGPAAAPCREDEIRKTTQADLTVLKWTENTKGAPRTLDCKEIAKSVLFRLLFRSVGISCSRAWVG